MKLETEKGIFHAHFWHHNISKRPHRVHMQTDVLIHPGPCKLDENKRCTLAGVRGEARQHARLDVFDKKVGRVVALDRALRGSTGEFLPRPVRTQIWASYFKQAKTPRSRGSH